MLKFADFLAQQQSAEQAQTSTYNDKRDQELTDEQKKSGEYAKGHIVVHDIPITIENPKNSIRVGIGREWQNRQGAHYGYFDDTNGADGDPIDVYVGDQLDSDLVVVVNQHDHETISFDEHKFLIGFDDPLVAVKAFQDSQDVDWTAPHSQVLVGTINGLKMWLKATHVHHKPVESGNAWSPLAR